MNLSTLITAWKAYRAVKPFIDGARAFLDRPWIKRILAAISKLFERAPEQKDAQGWTKTGRETFDSRLDPPSGGG